jgi:hypothetical protein
MLDEKSDFSGHFFVDEAILLINVVIVLNKRVNWFHVVAVDLFWFPLSLFDENFVDLANGCLTFFREKLIKVTGEQDLARVGFA